MAFGFGQYLRGQKLTFLQSYETLRIPALLHRGKRIFQLFLTRVTYVPHSILVPHRWVSKTFASTIVSKKKSHNSRMLKIRFILFRRKCIIIAYNARVTYVGQRFFCLSTNRRTGKKDKIKGNKNKK